MDHQANLKWGWFHRRRALEFFLAQRRAACFPRHHSRQNLTGLRMRDPDLHRNNRSAVGRVVVLVRARRRIPRSLVTRATETRFGAARIAPGAGAGFLPAARFRAVLRPPSATALSIGPRSL